MSDAGHTNRLLDALENSTRVSTEMIGFVKGMEREFVSLRGENEKEFSRLRESFNSKLNELEMEMRTTNSHLDNMVRVTEVTNELLREDMEDRKAQQAHRQKVETEEREWRRTIEARRLDRTDAVEDDTRNLVKKYMDSAWEIFKQPFGFLVAGVIFWVLIRYFALPPQMMVQTFPAQVPAPVEQGE